jgi:hypothetical protein
MGDKNPPDLTGVELSMPDQLMLGAFPTVQQPDLRALRELQSYTGNIAMTGGYTGTSSQKGEI